MAKRCRPLTVVASSFVLALGCRGVDSVPMTSERAVREGAAGEPAHAHDQAGEPGESREARPSEAARSAPEGTPAATLAGDPLDAPAATSVAEAERAAAMAAGAAGEDHSGHGAPASYRHVDAGRVPDPEPHDAAHDDAAAEAVYVCPMHPEVRSEEPGTCHVCGMTLERKEE